MMRCAAQVLMWLVRAVDWVERTMFDNSTVMGDNAYMADSGDDV